MTVVSYTLQSFPSTVVPDIHISGHIQRHATQLKIEYELVGEWSRMELPPPHNWPRRRDHLWTSTCFELFLAPQGGTTYWEVNMAPAGDWNVYRFSDYRVGMSIEDAIAQLPFTVKRELGYLQVTLDHDFGALFSTEKRLEVGISCIIDWTDALEASGQRLSYWALTHSRLEPDFHAREGFLLSL